MISNWSIFDFTIQWLWVGVIVVLAVIYIVGATRRSIKRSKNNSVPECSGCILLDKCEKSSAGHCKDGDSSSSNSECRL